MGKCWVYFGNIFVLIIVVKIGNIEGKSWEYHGNRAGMRQKAGVLYVKEKLSKKEHVFV